MSRRNTQREIILKMINQYKRSPCLWNPLNMYYHRKSARQDALSTILQIWQKYDPYTTLTDVKKKIEHLRAVYRREWRKVKSVECHAQLAGSYTPTLWYYDHMNFLSGKRSEESEEDSDSDSDDDETLYVNIPHGQKRRASESIDLEKQSETSMGIVEASAVAFGRSVGAQLHHLSKMQRCIAEKLISDVIYHAKLEHLTMNTSINMNLEDDNTSRSDLFDTKNIVIPETEPSWYDTVIGNGSGQESSSSCTFITNEAGVKKKIDHETENAVSFIKVELDDTPNASYGLELDDQRNTIDIVKEELVEP